MSIITLLAEDLGKVPTRWSKLSTSEVTLWMWNLLSMKRRKPAAGALLKISGEQRLAYLLLETISAVAGCSGGIREGGTLPYLKAATLQSSDFPTWGVSQ